MSEDTVIHTAELVETTAEYSLRELCEVCGVHAELVIEMVDYGILEPDGGGPEHWRFAHPALRRAQKAVRLRRDLGLTLAGLSLTLDLLDELDDLRTQVRRLRRQVRLLSA